MSLSKVRSLLELPIAQDLHRFLLYAWWVRAVKDNTTMVMPDI